MLELDLLLQPLVQRLADMSAREVELVQELLAHDDQTLWDALIARKIQLAPHLRELVSNLIVKA